MKNTIINLIAVVAVSFSSAAFAAEEMGDKAQPPAAQPVAAASAVPPATAAEATSSVPAPESDPAMKRSTSRKFTKASPARPKDLDLRHCLELDNNPAIARCARE
jgi:hypothetical protein